MQPQSDQALPNGNNAPYYYSLNPDAMPEILGIVERLKHNNIYNGLLDVGDPYRVIVKKLFSSSTAAPEIQKTYLACLGLKPTIIVEQPQGEFPQAYEIYPSIYYNHARDIILIVSPEKLPTSGFFIRYMNADQITGIQKPHIALPKTPCALPTNYVETDVKNFSFFGNQAAWLAHKPETIKLVEEFAKVKDAKQRVFLELGRLVQNKLAQANKDANVKAVWIENEQTGQPDHVELTIVQNATNQPINRPKLPGLFAKVHGIHGGVTHAILDEKTDFGRNLKSFDPLFLQTIRIGGTPVNFGNIKQFINSNTQQTACYVFQAPAEQFNSLSGSGFKSLPWATYRGLQNLNPHTDRRVVETMLTNFNLKFIS